MMFLQIICFASELESTQIIDNFLPFVIFFLLCDIFSPHDTRKFQLQPFKKPFESVGQMEFSTIQTIF